MTRKELETYIFDEYSIMRKVYGIKNWDEKSRITVMVILFCVVTVGLEPTSVRSMVARSPWSGLRSPFRANKLRSLAFGAPHRGDAPFICPIDVNNVLSLCSMAIATETPYLVVFRGFPGFLICAQK